MMDTAGLLRKFVRDGSEAAFRELVTRYFDLVYSTAVRLVDGDPFRHGFHRSLGEEVGVIKSGRTTGPVC